MKKILLVAPSSKIKPLFDLFRTLSDWQIVVLTEEKVDDQANDDVIYRKQLTVEDEGKFDIIILSDYKNGAKNFWSYCHSEGIVLKERKLQPFLSLYKSIVNERRIFSLIFETIQKGLLVIDCNNRIQLINERAKDLIGLRKDVLGKSITQLLPQSQLTKVLKTSIKEEHNVVLLENGQEILVNRFPLIHREIGLIGALAIFQSSNELRPLAEENIELRKVKTMLEAIIYASEEAISVVDEKGKGLMINPAYTKITGLSRKDVIGKPATVDIAEGESIHMQVLQSKQPIRGARLKVGPLNKDVLVNAAPIMVENELKGSVAVIHDLSKISRLTEALHRAKEKLRQLEATYTFDDIIGESNELLFAIRQAKIAAQTPDTVLLRGASGTGKELFAHAIHNASERKNYRFIRVNCAALTESVLESELFGYEGGAFTGSNPKGKKGIFEEADKGSIFLDEIGELSLKTQAKLLRVLQEKEIVRVGGTVPIPVDVRIIAATNANLEEKLQKKTFREDLYYRLNRLPIYIPALKDRLEDLPTLVQFFIHKLNQLYGRTVEAITDDALTKLKSYDWPGNVRELENVISRAMIFMDMKDRQIERKHIVFLRQANNEHVRSQSSIRKELAISTSLKQAVMDFEKDLIEKVYRKNNYNKQKTAAQLQISLRNLYYKLEKYQLD